MKNRKKGFTLAELLVVVAIIGVLVAISIPIFASQLEKSREATDAANIRAQYAEVMAAAITENADVNADGTQFPKIVLKQKKNGWQNEAYEQALNGLGTIRGTPGANGKAWVSYHADSTQVMIQFGEPVPGDKATYDAMNFEKGSNEWKILSSLADAERQALEEYQKSGETKAVGYAVTFNPDGTFTLTAKKNTQVFHQKNPASLVRDGYMVAVRDGKVGSNLKYDPDTNTLIGTPYHIYVNQWHNETEGINFDY